MTGKQIKNIILEWESEYPIDEWIVDGIHIWPMLRNKLYIYLLNLNSNLSSFTVNNHKASGNSTLNNCLKSFKKFKRLTRAVVKLPLFFSGLKPKKIIFFGSYFHRTKHREGYFNRFFDPMVDFHNLQDQVYSIEFQKVYKENFNQQAIIPLHKYLDHYKLLKKATSLFRNKDVKFSLPKYKMFYRKLTTDFPSAGNLNLQEEAVKNWVKKVKRTSKFFVRLFTKVKPNKIIFLSYNGFDDLAAALFAANKLNIKTVDFQHGPQTNVHMAYSHWTKIPEDSFNIMPKEYWCWDKATKQNIDKWAKHLPAVKSKVSGHPYLGYWAGKIDKNEIEAPYILYSLQLIPIQDQFPENLITVIENTKWQWVFRLHPRSSFGQNKIKDLLSGYGLTEEDYRIENSAQKPLPQTILGAMVHVTNFSGCVIESSMMAVPSIIIDKRGKEIFDNYLDGNSVFFLDKEKQGFEGDFIRLIEELKNTDKLVKSQKIVNPITF